MSEGDYQPERFESRAALAAKIDWEGGIHEAVDYGITVDMMPEGDDVLAEAWRELASAYAQFDAAASVVSGLLPEPGSEDGDDA